MRHITLGLYTQEVTIIADGAASFEVTKKRSKPGVFRTLSEEIVLTTLASLAAAQ